MQVFPAILNRFWNRNDGSRDFCMTCVPELEASSIRVAEYLTELPPCEVLEQKLKAAVAIARERLAARKAGE